MGGKQAVLCVELSGQASAHVKRGTVGDSAGSCISRLNIGTYSLGF